MICSQVLIHLKVSDEDFPASAATVFPAVVVTRVFQVLVKEIAFRESLAAATALEIFLEVTPAKRID